MGTATRNPSVPTTDLSPELSKHSSTCLWHTHTCKNEQNEIATTTDRAAANRYVSQTRASHHASRSSSGVENGGQVQHRTGAMIRTRSEWVTCSDPQSVASSSAPFISFSVRRRHRRLRPRAHRCMIVGRGVHYETPWVAQEKRDGALQRQAKYSVRAER